MKTIYYHGTTEDRLQKILSNGLFPTTSRYDAAVTAFGGNYLTKDLQEAIKYALRYAKETRQRPMIIKAQVEERTGTFDEDDVYSPADMLKMSSDHPLRNEISMIRPPFNTSRSANMLAKSYSSDYLERVLHLLGLELDERAKASMLPAAENALSAYIVYHIYIYSDERHKAPEYGKAFRTAFSTFIMHLKGYVGKTGKLNIRIPDKIGFRGANRILGICSFNGKVQMKYGTLEQEEIDKITGKSESSFMLLIALERSLI